MTHTLARVLVPTGMLGTGFPEWSVQQAEALGADVIALDAGTTDSGPHYLGAGVAKPARAAVARDLAVILRTARSAGIPVIVGSCGTSGTDAGVDWMYQIATEVAQAHALHLRVARIYSEQQPDRLLQLLEAARVSPLPPAGALDAAAIGRCSHVVGVLGAEPIIEVLDAGADLVLAGRATDSALIAALPLSRGVPAGAAWHGGKISECGDLCTTSPKGAGVLVSFDQDGFTVEPLDPAAACTPVSVAAHMLYENRDPFLLQEPSGTLDTSQASYLALDPRKVRVQGSRFIPAGTYTTKLEGAAPAGFQTMVISGIRDPHVLARLDEWRDGLLAFLRRRALDTMGIGPEQADLRLTLYGYDAIGARRDHQPPEEVAAVFTATAPDQATATQLAKLANPLLLHAPLPDARALPSYALLGSPAEVERGPVHEFALCHRVAVATPGELFRTVHSELHP